MKHSIVSFLLLFFVLSCSKDSSVADDPFINEEKVLIINDSRVLYTGVLSGKTYNTSLTNYYNLGIFFKSEDAFFQVASNGTQVRAIPAAKCRNSPDLEVIEGSFFNVENLGTRSLDYLFYEESGFIHVVFSNLNQETFGIGKINTSTKEFEVVIDGFYQDISAWRTYHYDFLDKKIYRFEDSFGLSLTKSVNITNGAEEVFLQNLGNIDLGTTVPIFESSFDYNFYFTTREGLNITLYKFNANLRTMTNIGTLPSTNNSVEDLYIVNSKNKVYYTSSSGATSFICTFDFDNQIKTETPIKGNSMTGTINGTNQIIFID